MVQFVSYLRRVLCKTRLIFPRTNGPNESFLGDLLQLQGLESHLRQTLNLRFKLKIFQIRK